MLWKCERFSFDTRMPILMGILNVTPDSFSDGGDFESIDAALTQALRMQQQGAHIIDVGGESTRPGSDAVNLQTELARTIPVVQSLAEKGLCVSIDTRHAEVARAALEAGASIINDVSGFRDPEMRALAASSNCGCVIMHMQGEPKTMQDNPQYKDVVAEVATYLKEQAELLESLGVAKERICIDPGPGFGKSFEQTRDLIYNIHELRRLGYPVMVAISRKSYLGHYFGITNPKDRDEVSAREALRAVECGASVIRTHNVKATQEALKDLRPLVFLALGANLPLLGDNTSDDEQKKAQINEAISHLCQLPDTYLVDVSSMYASKAAYKEDQPDFVNAVVSIRTGIPPRELLQYLQLIEARLGRERSEHYGPRTIDIDILDYQNYACDSEELTLPHPRMYERGFVMLPFCEIAPGHYTSKGVCVSPNSVTCGYASKIGS